MANPGGDGEITLRDLAAIPVEALRAVGPKMQRGLAEMGITSVLDLLEHYPRRYIDRTKRADISALVAGTEATVDGVITRIESRGIGGRRTMVTGLVDDGTGKLSIVFFNQPWRKTQLEVGSQVSVFGKLETYRDGVQMTNPAVDVLVTPAGSTGGGEDQTGTIVPVYPQSGKAAVLTFHLRRAVAGALQRTLPRRFADPLDVAIRDELGLVTRDTAYRDVHRPDTDSAQLVARHRLKFDEFLRMQLGLVARKRKLAADESGVRHVIDGALVPKFHAGLPFPLTDDQANAIAEIQRDMAAPAPMHRLLQGEVGSGKTVVALTALLTAVQGGYQGAFMAPTEVLAEQHELTMRAVLDGLTIPDDGTLMGERPVRVGLLTNRTSAADRRSIAEGLLRGEVDILVGTHALIYGGVEFAKLGLVVIDEQHRFGVEQRDLLRAKGDSPDVLVMTATPIPRTAAMLIYGDLDKTELRHLPAGRSPITTRVIGHAPLDRAEVYAQVRDEVAKGRQAYVVCPLVEGSEKLEAKAASEEFERLAAEELAGLRLGLLHGQMPSADKEAAMRAFRAGETQVLVSTTVIEVGVDVPNATMMVVEDADRFGLLQLHQLRGRIGRGKHASTCVLIAEPTTPQGVQRMAAMVESGDGFELAERDLEIRGAGEVFGERQAGWSDLKLGRLPRDEPIVFAARAVAERILDDDPELVGHAQLREEVEDLLGDAVEFLFKS